MFNQNLSWLDSLASPIIIYNIFRREELEPCITMPETRRFLNLSGKTIIFLMMSVPKMIIHNIRIDLCPEKTKNCPRRNRNSGRNLSFFNLRNPVPNKVFANKKYTGKKEKNLLNQMTTKRGKNQRNHFRELNSIKNIRKLWCLIAWKKEI